MNDWIPKVSETWTGAIPATLIYNKDKRQFYEKSFDYNELETEDKKLSDDEVERSGEKFCCFDARRLCDLSGGYEASMLDLSHSRERCKCFDTSPFIAPAASQSACGGESSS